MSHLDRYFAKRLIATGLVKADDEPTQASFDRAYEADITAIVHPMLTSALKYGYAEALDDIQKQVEDVHDVFGTRYSDRISRRDVLLLIENLRLP